MKATIKELTDEAVELTITDRTGAVWGSETLRRSDGRGTGDLDWQCVDRDDGYDLADWALCSDRKVGDSRHFTYSDQ